MENVFINIPDGGDTTDLEAQIVALTAEVDALKVSSYVGMIAEPTDTTYTLDLFTAYAGTINQLKIITASGTCTAAVAIGGTPVTGISAVSVSSSIATGNASAANTFTAGQKITLTISASSSPADLAFTLKFTR